MKQKMQRILEYIRIKRFERKRMLFMSQLRRSFPELFRTYSKEYLLRVYDGLKTKLKLP